MFAPDTTLLTFIQREINLIGPSLLLDHSEAQTVYENMLVSVLLGEPQTCNLMTQCHRNRFPCGPLLSPSQLLGWLCESEVKQQLLELIRANIYSSGSKQQVKVHGSARTGFYSLEQPEDSSFRQESAFTIINLLQDKELFSPNEDMLLFTPRQMQPSPQYEPPQEPLYQANQYLEQPQEHADSLDSSEVQCNWRDQVFDLPRQDESNRIQDTALYGHFLFGDSIKSLHCRIRNGVVECLVKWQPRKQGIEPAPSIFPSEVVARYAPQELIDYYQQRF